MSTSAHPDGGRYRLDGAEIVLPGSGASPGRGRGLAPSLGIAVPTAGGTKEARHPGFRRDGRRTSGAWIVERHDFSTCPICLSHDYLTDEHVPMRRLGGQVMTKTCEECNNKLGSTAEERLRALIDGEVTIEAASRTDGGLRGVRRATAAIRQVPFEKPTLHVTSGDPALLGAFASKEPFDLRYRLLDPYPAGIAVLKYAYLAACVWLAEIPMTDEAKSFREALLFARDGVETSDESRRAIGHRIQDLVLVDNASGVVGSIALVEPATEQARWTFVLGGRLSVPWPFTDRHPTDVER